MIQPGNCVLFDSGAAQVRLLVNSFFQICLKKAQATDSGIREYHPALADVRAYDKLLAIDSSVLRSVGTPIADFSAEKLRSLAEFFELAHQNIEGGGVKLENQRVFVEIASYPDSMALYEQAFSLIRHWSPWLRSIWDQTIKIIVPLCRLDNGREDGMGFTNKNFLGGFFVSPEVRRQDPVLYLNIAFAHELAHQVLYIYQFSGPLILEKDKWIFSGVRKVDRPAPSALHAAMALAYMLEAIKGLLAAISEQDRVNYLISLQRGYREGLARGLDALKTVKLSPLGETIVRDLAEALG